MADIKLFNINGKVKEYQSGNVTLEKELQTVIGNNIETFCGVAFLASEYKTTDGGQMDSIGIDENHCPVIFEYKRSMKEIVIRTSICFCTSLFFSAACLWSNISVVNSLINRDISNAPAFRL